MSPSVLRQPTAVIPLAMSSTALVIVLAQIAVAGVARQADEGTAARLWQLLMVAQMPFIAWFGVEWLPRAPRQAASVLLLQAAALIAAAAPVYLLNW